MNIWNECKQVPLPELLSFIVDNRGKTVPINDGGTHKLIATNCIRNENLYPNYEKIRYLSEETYRTWFRAHPVPGDIIFVCKGTPGKTCMVPNPIDFCIAQDMIAFRVNKKLIYNRYLLAVLRSREIQEQITNTSVGDVIPHFKKQFLNQLLIPVPSMDIQKKIGDLYFAISVKMELNKKINKNLDEQISSLYSYFFDSLPASKLEETSLPDFIFFQEGPGIRNWQYVSENGVKFINIRCISGGDLNLSTANMISEEEANGKYAHFMLNPYDIVMSCSGTLGRYAIVREEHLPLCLNTSVIRFRPATDFGDYSYVYGYMTSKEFLKQQELMANGSAQVNFGPTHLKKIVLHLPPKDLRRKFHEMVFPLINLKLNNLRENDRLETTRDILLPRLMSGELDVTDLDF